LCGHAIELHDADGCAAREPGTADAPPAPCACGKPLSRERAAQIPGVVLDFTRPRRA
jgi:hypothetical protein